VTVEFAGEPGAAAPAREPAAASGRVLRYALVMLFGWIVLGVVMVLVMHRVLGPVPPPAPLRPLAAAAAAPTSATAPRAAKPAAPANTIVVAADAQGHFYVDAAVNGAPVRFLVDTGASLVALTPADARAAGLATTGEALAIHTAHGDASASRTTLRRLRVDQFELDDVPAAVMDDGLPVSLLGVSFLSRLAGYSMRDGILTLEW